MAAGTVSCIPILQAFVDPKDVFPIPIFSTEWTSGSEERAWEAVLLKTKPAGI